MLSQTCLKQDVLCPATARAPLKRRLGGTSSLSAYTIVGSGSSCTVTVLRDVAAGESLLQIEDVSTSTAAGVTVPPARCRFHCEFVIISDMARARAAPLRCPRLF